MQNFCNKHHRKADYEKTSFLKKESLIRGYQTKFYMKNIYIIRHGQTDYNKNHIIQGSGVDSSLNDFGRQQALAFFERYQVVPFDKIYTSQLQRTKQSVQAFTESGLPTEHYEGLNEISWGAREGKKIGEIEDKYYHEMIQRWQEGEVTLAIDGGESPLDVQARQKPILDLLLSRQEEKNILVCMHGRAIRIFLSLIMDTPLQEMDTHYGHSNLCLYQLSYDNGQFQILKHNDTEHLEKLVEETVV